MTVELQDIFNEASADAIAEMVGPKLFEVKDTTLRTFEYQVIHGLAGVSYVADGADLPSVTTTAGDQSSWTQSRYGVLVPITKDMRIFDRYDQIESVARSVVEDSWQKIDQSMADVLLNGFSSSNYTDVYGQSVSATSPDAVALFSASHSNNVNSTVYRNLIRSAAGTANVVLSREAIVNARVDAFNHKDANGINRPVNLDTLIVSPKNYDEAMRVVNSSQISGSGENDINPLKGSVNVIQWSRLTTRTDGTDTSSYWFMADSKKIGRSLKALFRERPSLDPPEQVYESKNWEYSIDYYYALGRAFPAYIWGSNATG